MKHFTFFLVAVATMAGLVAVSYTHLEADAPGWKWARLAVWDVAADGAFTNPVWRKDK